MKKLINLFLTIWGAKITIGFILLTSGYEWKTAAGYTLLAAYALSAGWWKAYYKEFVEMEVFDDEN